MSKFDVLCSKRMVASVVQRCSVIIFDSDVACKSLPTDRSTLSQANEGGSLLNVYINRGLCLNENRILNHEIRPLPFKTQFKNIYFINTHFMLNINLHGAIIDLAVVDKYKVGNTLSFSAIIQSPNHILSSITYFS